MAALAAVFLHLVMFRAGAFVYLFHKTGSGVWIDEGVRVAGGELMYRDFHDTVGPGIVHLNAALARLFGAGLATFAWAGLALGVGLVAALHALSARFAGPRWRLLPPLLFGVLVYPPFDLGHPRWPALLLGLGAVGRAAGGAGFRRWAEAGLALGAASLFDGDVGSGLVLGLLVHLALARGSRAGSAIGLATGTLAPVLIVMGAFAAAAGPAKLLDAWPAGRLTAHDPHAWDGLASWHPRPLGHVVLALAGLAGGVWLVRRRAPCADAGPDPRCVGWAGLALLGTSLLGELDPYTLAHRALGLSVVLPHALARLHAASGARAWLARVALALLLPGLVHGSLGLVIRRQWTDALVRQRFRAGEAWIGAPNHELPWLESRARPGEFAFVFPAGGHSYALTLTRNATSFGCLVEGQATQAQQRQALAEIAARRPAAGVWLGAQRLPGAAVTLDTLYDGLIEAYEVERVLPNRSLLLRRRLGGSVETAR